MLTTVKEEARLLRYPLIAVQHCFLKIGARISNINEEG